MQDPWAFELSPSGRHGYLDPHAFRGGSVEDGPRTIKSLGYRDSAVAVGSGFGGPS